MSDARAYWWEDAAAGEASRDARAYDDNRPTRADLADDLCPSCRTFDCPPTCRWWKPPQKPTGALGQALKEAIERREQIDREWGTK